MYVVGWRSLTCVWVHVQVARSLIFLSVYISVREPSNVFLGGFPYMRADVSMSDLQGFEVSDLLVCVQGCEVSKGFVVVFSNIWDFSELFVVCIPECVSLHAVFCR